MTIDDSVSNIGPDRIRLGMIGGGEGAFIGAVHRMAARLDDQYELVAGALSSNADRARASGRSLGLAKHRCYESFTAMITGESGLDDPVEAVAIVTPNHVHFPVAKASLNAGYHVICDKPLTVTSSEAYELVDLAQSRDRILAVTYNYSGYPMIRQAREMIRNGHLGDLRMIQVEYAQDWLTEPLEHSGQKQAAWRVDPAKSGLGGAVADIGTHAFHLACFVSGLRATSLCADLTSFVDGRVLDDNASVLLRFENGAKGMLWASQVAPGIENGLRLRIYGSEAGLAWEQEHPNTLQYTPYAKAPQLIRRAGPGASNAAAKVSRIPAGHPEGYLEAFATIYTEIAKEIRANRNGDSTGAPFPRGADGAHGVQFIEKTVESSAADATWVQI